MDANAFRSGHMNSSPDIFVTLGQSIAAAQDAAFAGWKQHRTSGRAEFLMRLQADDGERRRRSRHRWMLGGASFAMASAAALAFVVHRGAFEAGRLTFEVNNETPGVAQAWIAAPLERGVSLNFSDGSHVDLQPLSRARVLELRDNGARVVLENGVAEVEVEPQDDNWWVVDAGPYRVEVLGTAFRVQWDAEHDAFSLELHHGRVKVSGPSLPQARYVASGENLYMQPEGYSDIVAPDEEADDDSRPGPAVVEPEAGASDSMSKVEEVGRSNVRRKGHVEDATSWHSVSRKGDFKAALHLAEAEGFGSLCASLPARRLLELADVARYAHAPSRAREALIALRQRFPGHEAAATAAFDLGRLSQGNCAEARRWLQAYLDEDPHGKMVGLAKRRLEECSGGG